jgi:hypothetical protein
MLVVVLKGLSTGALYLLHARLSVPEERAEERTLFQLRLSAPCCRGNFSDRVVMHAAYCDACRRALSAGPLRFTVNCPTVTDCCGRPAGRFYFCSLFLCSTEL